MTDRPLPTVYVDEPIQCSQGGIPYNKTHLDARDDEIDRLRQVCKDKPELLKAAYAQIDALRLALSPHQQDIEP